MLSAYCINQPRVNSVACCRIFCSLQGSQKHEVKFQEQIFSKFQYIFVGLMTLKTQKMHVFLCSQILIIQADQYCSHKNVMKASK